MKLNPVTLLIVAVGAWMIYAAILDQSPLAWEKIMKAEKKSVEKQAQTAEEKETKEDPRTSDRPLSKMEQDLGRRIAQTQYLIPYSGSGPVYQA